MFLFLSDVYGPESMQHFAERFRGELLERFRELGMVASIWGEHGDDNRYVIQGWGGEPKGTHEAFEGRELNYRHVVEDVERIVALVGWRPVTRVFSPPHYWFNWSIFPAPKPPGPSTAVTNCDMPNNPHPLSQGNRRCVPNGTPLLTITKSAIVLFAGVF